MHCYPIHTGEFSACHSWAHGLSREAGHSVWCGGRWAYWWEGDGHPLGHPLSVASHWEEETYGCSTEHWLRVELSSYTLSTVEEHLGFMATQAGAQYGTSTRTRGDPWRPLILRHRQSWGSPQGTCQDHETKLGTLVSLPVAPPMGGVHWSFEFGLCNRIWRNSLAPIPPN